MSADVISMPARDAIDQIWERQSRENFRSFLRHKSLQCKPNPVLPFRPRSGQLELPFEGIIYEITSRG